MFYPRVNFLDIEDDWVCPCKLRQQGRVGKATYKAINGLWRYQFLVDSEFVPGVTQLKSRLAKILIFRSVEYLKIQGR